MNPGPESQPARPPALTEVRYSLPEILQELKLERAAASFAMERLDQSEIGKLFKVKPRAKPQK